MINKKIRELLPFETIILESPAFDNSIIALSFDGRAIYEINRMKQELSNDEDISENDAMEFIEYNSMRTLPYMGAKAPIILEDTYYILEDEL